MPIQEKQTDENIVNNGNIAESPVMVNFDLDLWIENNAREVSAKRASRVLQNENIVLFKSGKQGKVSVKRLIPSSLAAINKQHELTRINGQPIVLDVVFIAKYETVYNDEIISKQLGVIGIVGKTAYLLTGSFNFAVQSSGGESHDTLNAMVHTVSKAIDLAKNHGSYNAEKFTYNDTESVTRNRPIVTGDAPKNL